ncbi:transporter substrate-binding domain-containing diguanylate cyclase [Acuticoccus kandeliae]|uniref:transporter substrate-binding domain-containing diguanylate cyclase n=1 Tax=Acuticoccus kandeliae TaxID=2073160 RepID=UPI000D3EDA00|nr:transporter substrate-binding domain-containing protein [Acuticoccus kandeliae]
MAKGEDAIGADTERTRSWFGAGLVLSWIFAFLASLFAAHAGAVELTEAERAWIAQNRTVSVGIVSDNEPYSFFRNGRTLGWTVDVLHRLEAETGLVFNMRMGAWPDIYGTFRRGGLDVIADISRTDERSAFVDFTDAYHLRRTVLFHNVDHPLDNAEDVEALRAKRVGVIKDIYYAGALTEAGITPIEYDTYRDLMAALAFGWLDAVLAAEMTGNFFARENGFSNVAVAGALPITVVPMEEFRLGVLKDDAATAGPLAGILEKAVAAIPTADLATITERWLNYRSGRDLSVTPLRLLPEEQAYIEEAGPLTIGFISDYEPFSYLSDGLGQGFAVELAHEISARTGLVLKPVYDNWANLLPAFRDGELDIISNISFTDERAAYTDFSQEYHRIPNAVFVRSGFGPYRGLESFEGKTVGIGEGIYYARALMDRIDGVVTYSTQDDILKALAEGEVDAAILALSNGNAIIRRLGLINIEIGGEFLMEGVEREDLRFGVSPRLPYVKSVIDRAMNAMPPARWNELETRWLGPAIAAIARHRVSLTTEERAYLDEKGVLKVCVDPKAPPFTTIDEKGRLNGVVADVLALLEERGAIDWQVKPVKTHGGDLAFIRTSDCDMVPFTMEPSSPVPGWTVTPPYLDLVMAVATPLHRPFIEGMAELAGMRVAIVPDRSPIDILARRYPDVTLIEVASEREGLRRLRDGAVDAVLGMLPTLGHLLAAEGATEVKISGRIAESARVVIATRDDEALLGSIVAKLAAVLEEGELRQIIIQHLPMRIVERVNYTRLIQLGLVAILVLLMVIYWNRKLSRLNAALNAANRKLQEVSITDGLTGISNRMHFDARAGEEFSLCQRNGWLFSIAMIDVDHFKPVNDEMGHVFGDRCLQLITATIGAHFRRTGDGLARYGGEEFVAFTMGGSGDDFVARLEAMRRAVERMPIEAPGGSRHLTVSIGCHVAVPEVGETLRDFIRAADERLYEAKRSGRNRLVAGTPPPEPGGPLGTLGLPA